MAPVIVPLPRVLAHDEVSGAGTYLYYYNKAYEALTAAGHETLAQQASMHPSSMVYHGGEDSISAASAGDGRSPLQEKP